MTSKRTQKPESSAVESVPIASAPDPRTPDSDPSGESTVSWTGASLPPDSETSSPSHPWVPSTLSETRSPGSSPTEQNQSQDASATAVRNRNSFNDSRSEASGARHLEADAVVEEGPTVISRGTESPPSVSSLDDNTSSETFARKLVGSALDHYRLDEYIGGGGMGAVFRAYDALLRRTVAVKILSKGSRDQELLRRFVNEAQSAAKLDHENIARVFFVGQDQGLNYIVFEYIEGRNIRQLVADEGVLPLSIALRYMCQLARALEHAAERHVIHRDIKPSNVVATPDHRAKLVDMGLARMHRLDEKQADLTASDMTLGTFDYISPEQARDPRAADTRSDLYSLGCTFYFMLTGEPPFPDGTALQKVLAHREAPRPDPRHVRPEIPESIAKIIQKLTASDPERRFQNANELLAELLLAAAELKIDVGLNESYIIEASVDRRDWFDRLVPWVAVAVLLAAVIGGIEWALPDSPTLTEPTPNYQNVVDSQTVADQASINDRATSPSTAPTASDSSPNNSSSAGGSRATEAPSAITTLFIADSSPVPPGSLPAGTAAVASLEAAVERALQEPAIREIQLGFNGARDSLPLVLPPRSLRIVAAAGSLPVLRFRASQIERGGTAIGIFGDEFLIRGVDVELLLDDPSLTEPVSIFRIEQAYADRTWNEAPIQEFEFFDGRFTVSRSRPINNNVASSASSSAPITPANQSSVPGVVLEIRRPESFFLKLPKVDLHQYPEIGFMRTLVRGNVNLVRAVPGTPFHLEWQKSAFASDHVALALGGIREDAILPESSQGANIDLQQVTILAPGLLDLRSSESTPAPLQVQLLTSRCWFISNRTSPLVHHHLFAAVNNDHLSWEGDSNLISGTSSLWIREVGMQPEQIVDLNSLTQTANRVSSVESLEKPQSSLTPPLALSGFLQNSAELERFEASDLTAAFAQLESGLPSRPGASPEDLPKALPNR